MRARLHCVSATEASAAGAEAAEHLARDPHWAAARCVLVYSAVRGEIDPRPVAERAWREGKVVLLPRPDAGRLDLAPAPWPEGEALIPGPYGIPVPARPGPYGGVDVAVVPGLAFDRRGGRLGSGLGYYDRWFALHPAAWRVAFAYPWQVVDEVPREAHDVPMHAVATPEGLVVVRLDSEGGGR